MSVNKFGNTPRMVVVIGETAFLAKSAEITLTNKAESDSAVVHFALENIDSSVFQKPGKYYAAQVYAGYIDEAKDSSQLIKDLIEGGQYKDKLFKRFDGWVDQPEWKHGNEETFIAHLKDAAGLLDDGKFSDKLEGSQTSAKSIIAMIQSNVKGIKVTFEGTDFNMGTVDSKGQKQTYSIAGKSYWTVIKDIAEHGHLNIEKLHNQITITAHRQYKNLWEMIRTASKDPEKSWSTYTELEIRMGDKGKRAKENVVVQILGTNTTGGQRGKSGKPGKSTTRQIDVRYPPSAKTFSGEENTEYIIIRWPGPISPEKAAAIAKIKALEYLKGIMTGNCEIPFANPEIQADEGISFKADKNFGLDHLNGKVFRIHSINESFSEEGYKQKVEFETNAHFEKTEDGKGADLKFAPAPTAENKKTVGYSLASPLGIKLPTTNLFGTSLRPFGPGSL